MPDRRVLFEPSPQQAGATAMHRFCEAIAEAEGLPTSDYETVFRFSIERPERFWQAWLRHAGIRCEGEISPPRVDAKEFRHGLYFPELRLNFAENLLLGPLAAPIRAEAPALLSVSESRAPTRLTFGELRQRVAAVAATLRGWGLQPGDRVAGMLANSEEAVIAMLATASLGGVWSSCSPDFGAKAIVDRFAQIEPKVLLATTGYVYGGKKFDCRSKIAEVAQAIPGLQQLVTVDFAELPSRQVADSVPVATHLWDDLTSNPGSELIFTPRKFNDALYIMFSSGTTGLPKCIVHGVGGTLLQHAKELLLHSDLRGSDSLLYFTTCGWMMWNWLVSGLFAGARIVLVDGSPAAPDLEWLWRLLADEHITHFGTSPKFLGACRSAGVSLNEHDLAQLRVILSTGAPLLPEDFDWIYAQLSHGVQLSSISGGTDIISCFMLGSPTLPVIRGELQCFGLGMDVAAQDARTGELLFGEKAELVCRQPFPSMPVGFWNDPDGSKYRGAYFDQGNFWRHGDFIEVTGSQGSCGGIVVHGRSDATLNRAGIRIGTAEIYGIVEGLAEVADSVVVGRPQGEDLQIILLVKLAPEVTWDDELRKQIAAAIRTAATPRHVPDIIAPVEDIPYTRSGKKVELAVREVLCGREPKNTSALANPLALDYVRAAGAKFRVAGA